MRIDWERVRARLRANQNALEEATSPSPALVRETFRRRAERLARRRVQEFGADSSRTAALIFRLGEELCALPLSAVAEVSALPRLARYPGAPPEMLGLANWRNEMQPVFDARALLDLPPANEVSSCRVIFLRRPREGWGLRIDELVGVESVSLSHSRSRAAPARYVEGEAGEGLLFIDPDMLFSSVKPKEME